MSRLNYSVMTAVTLMMILILLVLVGCSRPVCVEWKTLYECNTSIECPNKIQYKIPHNYTGNLSNLDLDIILPSGCEITQEIKINVSEANVSRIETETFIGVVGEIPLLYETPIENCTPKSERLRCERWA